MPVCPFHTRKHRKLGRNACSVPRTRLRPEGLAHETRNDHAQLVILFVLVLVVYIVVLFVLILLLLLSLLLLLLLLLSVLLDTAPGSKDVFGAGSRILGGISSIVASRHIYK